VPDPAKMRTLTARASDFFFPPGPTPGELASDFFIFIFFTVLPTAAPFSWTCSSDRKRGGLTVRGV